MTIALIIPSCRPEQLTSFLDAWARDQFWDTLIVIEDGPSRTFDLATPHHYSWSEIDAELGGSAWIISRRDSAVRSFGFWKAHQLGSSYIVTLDDDCFPLPGQDYFGAHLRALHATPRWTESIPGMRTRGLPYHARGTLSKVVMNVGLWTGVPDLDAPHQLVRGSLNDFVPPDDSRVMPRGQYAPICGMNLCFQHEFAPLAYFPLQGDGWPYRRFDDIWFGIFAQKICDHLGWQITMGRPWVHHTRRSDVYQNLVKEAPGIGFNERFWEAVDAVDLSACGTPIECMRRMGQRLPDLGTDYLRSMGLAIEQWAELFDANSDVRKDIVATPG